ncbi:MAG: hypothetical protein JOY93_07590, partial [Acidobacteriales bacterium]|nr:hypothetical protein [Terriglobales bacterium]
MFLYSYAHNSVRRPDAFSWHTLRFLLTLCAFATILIFSASCGETYRPVATPITPNPPNPSGAHLVYVLADNGPSNRGTANTLDVSGDTYQGVAKVGLLPVHATLTPNQSRVYVANRGDDTVSAYTASNPFSVLTISMPAGSMPVFVHTTQNDKVYVANYGAGTVAAIATAT